MPSRSPQSSRSRQPSPSATQQKARQRAKPLPDASLAEVQPGKPLVLPCLPCLPLGTPSFQAYTPFQADRVTGWLLTGGHLHDPADDPDPLTGAHHPYDPNHPCEGAEMLAMLKSIGVTHILNVAAEVHERARVTAAGMRYLKLPLVDTVAQGHLYKQKNGERQMYPPAVFTLPLMWVALEMVRAARAGKPFGLYVHCHSGQHRGPLIATFLLAALGALDGDEAWQDVARARPDAKSFDFPLFRDACLRALLALGTDKQREKPQAPKAFLAQVVNLLAKQFPQLDDTPHAIVHSVSDPFEQAMRAGEESRHTRAAALAQTYAYSPVDQQQLTAQTFAAGRSAFLARWAELGMAGEPAPRAAMQRLYDEAQMAVAQHARGHNQAVAQFAARTLPDGPPTASALDALHSFVASYVQRHAPAVASMQVRRGQSLADLYAGGPGAQYRLAASGREPECSCPQCSRYQGKPVSSEVAWKTPMPAHPGCTHVWRLSA